MALLFGLMAWQAAQWNHACLVAVGLYPNPFPHYVQSIDAARLRLLKTQLPNQPVQATASTHPGLLYLLPLPLQSIDAAKLCLLNTQLPNQASPIPPCCTCLPFLCRALMRPSCAC